MAVKIETVIEKYLNLREKRSQLKKEYDAADMDLKDKMEKIETYLLKQMQDEGVEAFKTTSGTAFSKELNKYSCADWTIMWDWCAKNRRVDMLEKRISSAVMKEYQEDTGNLPPGVNVMVERVVSVRRPS